MLGLDYLGLGSRKWPIKDSVKLTPKGFAIGCFWDTFGKAQKHIKAHLNSGNVPAIRVHLHWADNHKIAPLNTLRKKAISLEKLAKAYPTTTFYASHSCEYKEKKQSEVQKRIDILKKHCPSCIPVNSPLKGSATTPNTILEYHGDTQVAPGQIVSTDGTNLMDINAEQWMAQNTKALITFIWGMRFNLRENTKAPEKPPPPKKRTQKPSPQYIKSLIRLASPPEKSSNNIDTIPLKKPELYKSHSEDSQEEPYEAPEPERQLKPMLICKIKAPYCDIILSNGSKLGKFIFGGTYPGGLNRYYAGAPGGIRLYGYEIGERAKKLSGSELIYLKFPGVRYGPICPAFRTGYFR